MLNCGRNLFVNTLQSSILASGLMLEVSGFSSGLGELLKTQAWLAGTNSDRSIYSHHVQAKQID